MADGDGWMSALQDMASSDDLDSEPEAPATVAEQRRRRGRPFGSTALAMQLRRDICGPPPDKRQKKVDRARLAREHRWGQEQVVALAEVWHRDPAEQVLCDVPPHMLDPWVASLFA